MASKNKIQYKCSVCGYTTSKWSGQCGSCKEWNTFEEFDSVPQNQTYLTSNLKVSKEKQMKDVNCVQTDRITTGINEFDRVVGGGLVNDSITILSSPPGGGKSTLCLELCNRLIEKEYNVLYASGEESETQIKNRAIRLKLDFIDDLWISDNPNLDTTLNIIEKRNIDIIIIDSIQTFYLNGLLPSKAGNPTQVNECANALRSIAKKSSKPRAIIIIGQMTKDDELAGTRALEHLVDTYIQLFGERDESLRMLFALKNRFGNIGEMGFFNMEEEGLVSIDNPSEYFMTERQDNAVGTALTVIKEGSRPVIAEIESLLSQSYTPYPSRIGEPLRKEQLNVLISILEQRGKINLFNKNVVIKTCGGIKLTEQSANLAVLMTIASSYYDVPISNKTIFIADVGLTGELKKVPNLEMRIKELDRMNYQNVYIAPNSLKDKKFKNINVIECKTLIEVLSKVFGDNVKKKRSE